MVLNIPLAMWIEKKMRRFTGAEPAQDKLVGPYLTERNNSGVNTDKTIGKMNKIQAKVVK